MVQAIVLAGGKTNESLQSLSSAENEALIDVGSRKMIQYVVEALKNSERVKEILVVGPSTIKAFLPSNVLLEEPSNTILDNLLLGLSRLGTSQKVLVVASDIPFLTTQAVNNFLSAAELEDADFYYPIVAKDTCEERFPQVSRTYVKLKDGTFTGGNIFLLNPRIISSCKKEIDELLANRKKPVKMLRVLGFSFLLKFLLKQLTIKDLEEKINYLFKVKGLAIVSNDPEIGVDIDKAQDLELAVKLLGQK